MSKGLRIVQDLALVPQGKSCALMIRHADRDGPQDRVVDKDPGTNEQGRRRAVELGKALRRFDNMRILSSPMRRCLETGEGIAEGYGAEHTLEATDFLGPRTPFMLRPDDAYVLMRSMGLHGFVQAYVDGRIDKRIAMPCEQGTRTLFLFALERMRDTTNCAVVMVTHDLVLTPALVTYFGYDFHKNGLVPFLDGMVLYDSDYGHRVAYGGRVLKVAKDGAPRS